MILQDYHIHTTFCDGASSPECMVQSAMEKGLQALGFSAHMDPEISLDYPAYRQEILRLRERYAGQLDIFLGVELDQMYHGAVPQDLDYVIGSTHYLDVPCDQSTAVDDSLEKLRYMCETCFHGDGYAMCRAYYALEAEVYARTGCTFVGHFDLISRFNEQWHFVDEEDERYLGPARESMKCLAEKGVPFEINCGALNRGRKTELYPRMSLLRALHDMGGRIFLSSDAHDSAHIAAGFDVARERARACGFREYATLKKCGGKTVVYSAAL